MKQIVIQDNNQLTFNASFGNTYVCMQLCCKLYFCKTYMIIVLEVRMYACNCAVVSCIFVSRRVLNYINMIIVRVVFMYTCNSVISCNFVSRRIFKLYKYDNSQCSIYV